MREFIKLKSLTEVDDLVVGNLLSLVYISRVDCSVCHGLKPQVARLLEKYPLIAVGEVDADEVPEIAGAFNIFTVPVLILFVEGKEYLREARIVHMQLLEERLDKVYEGVIF